MWESHAARAKWDDVNEDTFISFAQFAYTGDYSVPTMVQKQQDTDCEERNDEKTNSRDLYAQDPFFPKQTVAGRAPKRTSQQWIVGSPRDSPVPFESRIYGLAEPRSRFSQSCEPAWERGSSPNIKAILLLHASLYVLADKWDVPRLKSLSLYKLHRSLTLLDLSSKIIPDIIEVIRYIYSDETHLLLN